MTPSVADPSGKVQVATPMNIADAESEARPVLQFCAHCVLLTTISDENDNLGPLRVKSVDLSSHILLLMISY